MSERVHTEPPAALPGLLAELPHEFDGPAWLVALREAAVKSLRKTGLPTKKTEAWRFTPIKDVVSTPRPPATLPSVEQEAIALLPKGPLVIPVVGGRVSVSGKLPKGLRVLNLSEALSDKQAMTRIGRIAARRSFCALNQVLFEDAVLVFVSEKLKRPIELVFSSPEASTSSSHPRVLFVVEPNAEAKLIERFVGGENHKTDHLTNAVTECVLRKGAHLSHTRVHADAGRLISNIAVRQDENSHYVSDVATFGGRLMRLDLVVSMEGDGSTCELRGVYHASDKDHIDHHVRVDHRGSHCSSRQLYHGVIADRATSVFDGKAIVHPGTIRSEAHQHNRNLLLSDTATVHTKPHLEIDNDDVVASHGATVGALPQEQLFYLMSRGVPKDLARSLLIFGFLDEVLSKQKNKRLNKELTKRFLSRLPNAEALSDILMTDLSFERG